MAEDKSVTVPLATRASDLPVRAASAAAMLAVAAAALWAGGIWLDLFVGLVALATFGEFVRLVLRAVDGLAARALSVIAGALYIGAAGYVMVRFDSRAVLVVIGAVVFVDTFAYFFGRALGGPKIAPRISPSKTWAGLLGGIVGASLWIVLASYLVAPPATTPTIDLDTVLFALAVGAPVAVFAQAGDFFESWLKRRACLKDSSNLIPGHGGVFDRTDGLIPVVILAGLYSIGLA